MRPPDGVSRDWNKELRTEVGGGPSKTVYKQQMLKKMWGYPDLS